MKKALPFLTLLTLGLVNSVHAAVLEGIDFPDKNKVAGKELVLNGVGLRTATMFKVRVYAAGLYVAAKSKSAAELLAQPNPKQLRMVFLRDVDAEDMQKAWAKTFESNCAQSCDALQPALKELQVLMQPLKKGDSQVYTFEKDAVSLAINGQPKGKVTGESVAKFLLSTWLGDHPPSEGLRDGLLGL